MYNSLLKIDQSNTKKGSLNPHDFYKEKMTKDDFIAMLKAKKSNSIRTFYNILL